MAEAPESLRDIRNDLKRAFEIMAERRPDYVMGRDMYDGTRVEVAASKYVRKIIEQNADAYPIFLAHIPVDVIVDMVELTSLDAEDKAAARLLDIVTERNDAPEGAEDWLRKAAYFGDYYAIVDPVEEDGAGRIVPESIRWIGSSPLTTIIVYDKSDERTPLYGVKVWADGKRWCGRVYYDDCTVKIITPRGSENLNHKAFELDFEEEEADAFIFHEGKRMLIEHLAIDGKPYGTPLHRKAWGPQDAITKISATNLANVEALGLPARWALLDPLAEVDDDIDDDFGTDGPGTAADQSDGRTNPTSGSRLRTIPGGISFLKGIKETGTYENGEGDIFLSNMDWYTRAMAVACGIPLFEFDLKGDQPSGESRRRAMSRALKKAKRVRRAEASFLEGLAETTLAVLGKPATVTATFYPIETSTDKEGLELVGAKISNGVPVRHALLEAGYPDDLVASWWPDDQPAVTMAMLTILGNALSQLGTAMTLGVVTEEEVRDMLPTILTAARNEGPEVDPVPDVTRTSNDMVVNPGEVVKAKADALGALIRSGADPEQASDMVGLPGLSFPNVPVTVRVPTSEATVLEDK